MSTESTSTKKVNLELVHIKPLDISVSRAAFCCGVDRIDNFYRNNIKDQHTRYRVRAYIAKNENAILGYYYLVATSHNPNSVSEEAIKKFGRVASTPCVYLGMLGVQQEYKKNGIGKILLLHAMSVTLHVADMVGIYALTLDALNEDVAKFYAKLGFERFIEGELSMFIPLATIRKLIGNETNAC